MRMFPRITKVFIVLSFLLNTLYPFTTFAQQQLILTPDYMGFIQQRVNYHLVYPNEAKSKGWEGIVKVKFTLAGDGRVKDIDIVESSGYPLLDAAAILAIKDASPYPFPQNYPEEEVQLVLPVSYNQPKPLLPAPSPTPKKEAPRKEAPQPTPAKEEVEKAALPELPPIGPLIKRSAPIQVNADSAPLSIEAEPKLYQEKEGEAVDSSLVPQPEELKYFMNIAVQNNQPTKIAQEEIALAKIKVIEAQRGVLPTVKLTDYYTEGTTVAEAKYAETEMKAEIEQPLYYSGRLRDTIRQSKANLEITKKNYDRLELDVVQKAETAYYNLVSAKMHLREKRVIRAEAAGMLEKIEKLSKSGMVIQLEAISARSWYKQVELQIKSIEQELFMAELTFKQVMNVKETPQVRAGLLGVRKLDLDFQQCLEVALKYRPEIYLSEMLIRFNRYGKKIEDEKGSFKTDLVGSYGIYSGHFVTEPWKESRNWYLGFKVTKPWGPSTSNAAVTSEKVEPRFGQTSPTSSTTYSGELNLLDNMKSLSEKKKSGVDLMRSISDLDETLKTIHFEVQDAFLKYEKAILQLNTAEGEMQFRKTQAEITKTRSMVGEAEFSGAIESLYSYSEAHTRYIQALANYYLSLANLKKACGYGLQI